MSQPGSQPEGSQPLEPAPATASSALFVVSELKKFLGALEESLLAAAASGEPPVPVLKARKDKGSKGDKKERKPRKPSLYNVFVLAANRKLVEQGLALPKGVNAMSVASKAYAAAKADAPVMAAFEAAFQPFIDQIDLEDHSAAADKLAKFAEERDIDITGLIPDMRPLLEGEPGGAGIPATPAKQVAADKATGKGDKSEKKKRKKEKETAEATPSKKAKKEKKEKKEKKAKKEK